MNYVWLNLCLYAIYIFFLIVTSVFLIIGKMHSVTKRKYNGSLYFWDTILNIILYYKILLNIIRNYNLNFTFLLETIKYEHLITKDKFN